MENDKREHQLMFIKRLFWVLFSTASLLLLAPAHALAETCAPGSTTSTVATNTILVGDQVSAPWTNETPVQLRSAATIDGVSGIRADLVQWAPVAFDSNGQLNVENTDFLEFKLRSSIENPPVNVIASSGVVCPLSAFTNLSKNRWVSVQIPLSSLGLVNQQSIGRLKLKSAISGPFTLWVANVRLTTPDPGSSSPVDTGTDNEIIDNPYLDEDISADPLVADFIEWHRDPGVRGEIDDHIPTVEVTLNANGQDRGDDTASFKAAINAISQGGVINVPAGTYYLSSPIELGRDNQIIRGAGSDRTRLIFTRSMAYGIAIAGQYPQAPVSIVRGGYLSSSLLVEGIVGAAEGKYALLTDSQSNSSQVVAIESQRQEGSRTILSLSRGLNSAYSDSAYLQLFDANEFSGIEALTLDVNNNATHIGDMIFMRSAANSWLRDVVSRRARQSHVFTRQTYHCEITGNVFLDATGHGDGKQGYGVDLANSTTGCLVENNTLGYLRHSILLNASANGNVIAFNHSFSPRHTNFAEGGPGDISFHSFSYANLVEGNVVERIHIGDAGVVGGGNVIHRNCVTSGPLTIDNSPTMVQNIFTNAMYGTDARLQSTLMPPVLPETPQARPYVQAGTTMFDDDGINVGAAAQAPLLLNNWYRGEQTRTGGETPSSFYGAEFAPLLLSTATADWTQDCQIPAVDNAAGR